MVNLMKNYRVTVNGVIYDVVVEEVNGAVQVPYVAPAVPVAPVSPVAPAPVAPAPVAAPVAAPAPAPVAASAGQTGAVAVKAPMPGSIVKVNVKVGDSVKQGDVLCVLEAMKMENEILAPQDGTVASVETTQGATVATDAVLITMN